MKFENVYFINGNAYAGKSTLVKKLAETHNGIACEENYHNACLKELDPKVFPNLTYTRDLEDWHDFVRRSPEEYERWIIGVSKECEILELRILEKLSCTQKPISVNRFFNRPDKEKQFLYRLLMDEPDSASALENFRHCLSRINSVQNYNRFLNSGFRVLLRDDSRTIDETLTLAEKELNICI